jgi:hypothetical protein
LSSFSTPPDLMLDYRTLIGLRLDHNSVGVCTPLFVSNKNQYNFKQTTIVANTLKSPINTIQNSSAPVLATQSRFNEDLTMTNALF